MVVDTSAVVAILNGEPVSEKLAQALDQATAIQISAASVLELALVLESRFGEIARKRIDRWLQTSRVEVIAVTRDQVEIAREGFRKFGKGRHPAALNFGDCFPYALARRLNETLLFVGNDFALTDLRSALK